MRSISCEREKTYNGDAVVVDVGDLVEFLLWKKKNVNAEKEKKIIGCCDCSPCSGLGELDQDKRCGHTELGVLAVGPGSAIGVSHLYSTDNEIKGIRKQTY